MGASGDEHGEYRLAELLSSVASRLLEDSRAVFVGTGLPMIATMLAQRTHAPNLLIIFEAGGVGPRVPALPISVGDSRTFYRAVAASSMHDVMSAAQAGYIDYGFLGAAAVDAYGNINTTVIGDWERPRVRLPGSGGANDVGSFCWQTLYMRNQSPPDLCGEAGLLHRAGLAGRAGAAGGGRPALRLRALPRHHPTGGLWLRRAHPADVAAQFAPRRHRRGGPGQQPVRDPGPGAGAGDVAAHRGGAAHPAGDRPHGDGARQMTTPRAKLYGSPQIPKVGALRFRLQGSIASWARVCRRFQ